MRAPRVCLRQVLYVQTLHRCMQHGHALRVVRASASRVTPYLEHAQREHAWHGRAMRMRAKCVYAQYGPASHARAPLILPLTPDGNSNQFHTPPTPTLYFRRGINTFRRGINTFHHGDRQAETRERQQQTDAEDLLDYPLCAKIFTEIEFEACASAVA